MKNPTSPLYNWVSMSHIRRPMAILSILLTTIIIIVSILIVLVVLVQRPKQEGLGASFGSSTFDSTLGAGATDFLQKLTTYLGIIFFVSAITLSIVKSRQAVDNPAENTVENVGGMDDFLKQQAPANPTVPELSPADVSPTPPTGTDATPEIKVGPETPEVSPPPAEVPVETPKTPEAPATPGAE